MRHRATGGKMKEYKFSINNLPKVDDPLRRHLLKFTEEDFYEKELEAGLPFFSNIDMNDIERYQPIITRGITWKMLMEDIRRKGWLIKESTIKSYVQKELIPRASLREKTCKGMISLFPWDTIRHLNFVRYWLFSSRNMNLVLYLNKFFGIIELDGKNLSKDRDFGYINDLEMIEDAMELYGETESPGIRDIEDGIVTGETAVNDVRNKINNLLPKNDEREKKYFKKLSKIEELSNDIYIESKELSDSLSSHSTPINEIKEDLYNLSYWREFILYNLSKDKQKE
jgi:hypothetical protein